MMPTHEDIAAMSDDDVVRPINARAHDVIPGMSFWIDELHRRRIARAEERIETLTRRVLWLTAGNVIVAAVAAVAAILAFAAT